jgi:hypothetical protein
MRAGTRRANTRTFLIPSRAHHRECPTALLGDPLCLAEERLQWTFAPEEEPAVRLLRRTEMLQNVSSIGSEGNGRATEISAMIRW